ncbi:MAG: hypothetical protein WCF90_08065 [Methanomicrobiales archaeon]
MLKGELPRLGETKRQQALHTPAEFCGVTDGSSAGITGFCTGWVDIGAGTREATTGALQIPQNFSVPVTGLPRKKQT